MNKTIISHGIFIAIYAILYSMLEIEIEGKAGWAKNLPTAASGIGRFTIYHLLMNLIVIITIAYAINFTQSSNILTIIFFIVSWFLIQDYMWFILNPFYTFKKYTQKNIPWHGQQMWILNMPLHNWLGLIGMLLIAILNGKKSLIEAFVVMGVIVLCGVILSPIYHKWYTRIH